MSTLLLIALVVVQAGVPDSAANAPRRVMRLARYGVEDDSVAAVAAHWSARLARDSTDRAALLGLATLARLTNDDSTAERHYRQMLRLVPARDDPYSVYARLGLARLSYEAIDMETADSIVQIALAGARALRDRAAEGDALQALGNARVDALKSVGLAYLDSALRALPATETDMIAGVRCRRALVLFYMGDARMRSAFDSALAYATRVKAVRAEHQCLRAAARDLWGRGLEDSSIVMLRRAIDIERRIHDRRSLAFALTTLADVMRDQGAYTEARDALTESITQARASGYQEAEALAKHMLGTLYYSLHDLPTATSYFDQAMAQYVAMDDTADQMNVHSWQANIARDRGDLATARRLTTASIEFDKQSGAIPGVIELYHALADVEMLAGDWTAAAAALDSSKHLLETRHIETWRPNLIYQRGRLALHRGDLDSAERIFRGYLGDLDSTENLRKHETRTYLADILARRGDLAGAERELTVAGDAFDTWRATLSDRQLRIMAFQATSTDESDGNSTVARVLAALAAGGRADAAFGLAERRRARELGQRLLEASALETSSMSGAPLKPKAVTTSSEAGEIASLIPDDSTAIVEFVTGILGAPTTAFAVTRHGGSVRAVILPPADSLTAMIGRLVALLSRGGDVGVESKSLGNAILAPVLGLLDPSIARLVIVPDGPLHRVPWDVLRLSDGRYAVQRYAIAIAPSVGTVGVLWRRPHPRLPTDSTRLLAFGDPAFVESSDLPRLPGSGEEVRTVARYAAHAEVRLRDKASAAYLHHAPLERFQVLHFATHALVDDRALGRTMLALAPDSSGSGLVTPTELAGLRLKADLVVLSACRTAGGVVIDGEGIQGLTASLLEAGARSIIATSWRVGDQSTVRFVDRLYTELATGKPVVEALRATKLASLEEGAPPAVWAAFSVVGDPMVVVPLREPLVRRLWWARTGGLVVMLIALAAARRRRRSVIR